MKLRIRQVSESEFTVQGHGVHTAFKELANALAKRDDTTVIINKKAKVDITHIHTVGLYSLFFLLFGSGKKVVSAHVVPKSFIGSLAGAKYWLPLANVYLRWFYNRADLVLAVSDETKRELKSMGVTKPIEIFYNIADTTRYANSPQIKAQARQALEIAPEAWVVICCGQVQPRKRVDDFISVAKSLPDMKFIWVGGMPFGNIAAEHAQMNQIMNNTPPNVIFTGVIPFESVKNYYLAADVFFLPSEQETFGLVIVEGAAAGLPVVLRDIPDYTETFKGDALLVPGDQFVNTLWQLRQDKNLYQEVQVKSSAIAKRYDSKNGADQAVALYKRII